jgi:shikimate dehydrogenase
LSASPYIACVFGNPIEQSKSPIIHQMFAAQCGINLHYTKRYAEVSDFVQSAESFFAQEGTIGANVTMPFKQDALAWVSTLSSQAQRAGAVNTIIRKDDHFVGDNTDGIGLVNDLKNHHVQLESARVLMVGAGGAAKGVLPALIDAGVSDISIYNRTLQKADDLVAETTLFKDDVAKTYTAEQTSFDLIINATSLSLYNELPALPDTIFSNQPTIYDMVYHPSPTIFMQKANSEGCNKVIDGLGMLVNQAAQSFFLWFGQYPDVHEVHQYLKSHK